MTLSFAPKRSSCIYIYISRPFNFAALIRFVSPESCESVSLFPRLCRWNRLTLRVWEKTAQETHNTKLFPWLYYLVNLMFACSCSTCTRESLLRTTCWNGLESKTQPMLMHKILKKAWHLEPISRKVRFYSVSLKGNQTQQWSRYREPTPCKWNKTVYF